MYCLKCRRETENITTATSKNGRLMRRGQCVTCGKKTKTQFIKRDATGVCPRLDKTRMSAC